MNIKSNDEQLWNNFRAAENAFYEARMKLVRGTQDLAGVISMALKIPSQRGHALRLLEIVPEEMIRQQISTLVDLVSVGHSDIELCRSVILRIDKDWLVKNIDHYAAKLLENGGEEEYRRIAELYKLLDSKLLDVHLKRCAIHANDEVREIAADFAQESTRKKREP
jgi:hypothetical protein